jgi:hypothetical protein
MNETMAESIEELFDAAAEAYGDYRYEYREPLVRSARLILTGGATFNVMTRNISRYGVGLKHSQPLAPGNVRLEINMRPGATTVVNAELLWCSRHGDHYISGAQFLEDFQR